MRFTTEIWSADSLKQIGKYDSEYSVDQQFEIQDQKRIISANRETVTTLDINTGELQVITLKLEGNEWRYVSRQANFAITHLESEKEYHIWNLAEQKIVNKFKASFGDMQLSRDGQLLISTITAGDETILVRDVQTMQPVIEVVAEGWSTVAVSPDSRLLAILSDNIMYIIDLQTKLLIQAIPVESSGNNILLFSPDSQYIALPIGELPSDVGINQAVDVVVISTGLLPTPPDQTTITPVTPEATVPDPP
jgi:WD40 repeat protein